jgi:hypothetical protein
VKSQFSLLIRSQHWTAIILTAIITSCGVSQPPPPIVVTPDIDAITDPVVLQASSVSSPGGIVVLSSDPTANAFNVFPKSPITLTFNAEMNRSSVERSVSLFPGQYDPASNPPNLAKLNLTSMCNGRWRVQNPNAVPVSFKWDVYKKPEQGVGVVPANGEALFQTARGF